MRRVQLAEDERIFDVSELRSGEKERGGGSKSADIEKEKDSSAGRAHEQTKAQTRARI